MRKRDEIEAELKSVLSAQTLRPMSLALRVAGVMAELLLDIRDELSKKPAVRHPQSAPPPEVKIP